MPDPRYTVSTPDGEMTYGSLEMLRQAYELKLIAADDLVREEGEATPRPARMILAGKSRGPVMTATRPPGTYGGAGAPGYLAMGFAVLCIAALESSSYRAHLPASVVDASTALLNALALPSLALSVGFIRESGLNWGHVLIAALLADVVVRGLWAAGVPSFLFLASLAGYFGATGRIGLSAALAAASLGPIAMAAVRWRKRVALRQKRVMAPRVGALGGN